MEFTDVILITFVVLFALILAKYGIRTIRPTERAVIERFGKYKGFRSSGLTFVIPVLEKLYMLNITEQITDVKSQVVITKDNLNAVASLQIYHKIKEGEEDLKNAFYKVRDVNSQIVSLAETTMRNTIGKYEFKAVNSERKTLNDEIRNQITTQITNWGVEVVRVELKEIDPPKDVQISMNSIIEANNLKLAAVDKATAAETEADGLKRAAIKKAEGQAEAIKKNAEGEANAITTVATAEATKIKTIAEAEANKITTVNKAIESSFTGNVVLARQFDVNENSLKDNTKIIFCEKNLPAPMIVISDKDGQTIVPIPKPTQPEKK